MNSYVDEIKVSVKEAINNLQAAKAQLEVGQYKTAASRASDAAFHTARALLLDEDIEPARHGDVITLIQEVFVNGRRLTKEQGANLNWLFAMKHVEDRDASKPVTSEEAHKAVEIAANFFEAGKIILEG